MKRAIKSVIIGALVALSGGVLFAEDAAENADLEVAVQLSVTGETNALEVLNAELQKKGRLPLSNLKREDWVVWPEPNTDNAKIVSMEWAGEDPNDGLTLKGLKTGTAEAVLRYKGDLSSDRLDVEYTFNVCVSLVDIEKTVVSTPAIPGDEDDHSNATIRIVSHVDCGAASKTNNILYIGSLCGKHELKQDTVKKALEAVVAKANVDWYFYDYGTNTSGTASYRNVVCKKGYYGSFSKGDVVTGLPSVGNTSDTKHCNLKAYMSLITNKLDITSMSYKQYDYIILEFDSDRMLEYYDSDQELENCVARCMKKFYEKHLVLWLVDNDPSKNPWGTKDPNTPWWTPTTYTKNGAAPLDGKWNGYVALFDPATYYAKPRGQRYVSSETKSGVKYYKANRIAEQVTYGNPTEVVNAIEKYVVLSTFKAEVQDTVVTADKTMNIVNNAATGKKDVKFFLWNGKNEPEAQEGEYYADLKDWKQTGGEEIKIDPANDHAVLVSVSNILGSTWTKIEIPVRTEADFMEKVKADAEGPQKFAKLSDDGKSYKVNPNDGDAQLTLYRSTGSSSAAVCAAGAAALAEKWDIPVPLKDFLVCSSNAVRVYDGIATNILVLVTNEELIASSDYVISNRNVGAKRADSWKAYQDKNGWYTEVIETNVEFMIAREGYHTYYGTNTVKITPKSISVSADSKTKVYGDATAPTLTHSGGIGLVTGQKLVVDLKYDMTGDPQKWAVDSYENKITTNAIITVTSNEDLGDFTKNYDISFTRGNLTVTPATIPSKEAQVPDPSDPQENPNDQPPIDPNCSPTNWAQNIVMTYNGTGTNIFPKVYNAVEGNTFEFQFTTNHTDEGSWYSDPSHIAYTNVLYKEGKVDSYKVWYRTINNPNYYGVTNYAYVTILPRGLTNEFAVAAIETNMIYEAEIPKPTWEGGKENLVEGDTLYVNLAYTNALYGMKEPWPVGKYPEAIVTNLTDGIVVTNKFNEDVTANYTIEFKPATLTISEAEMAFVPESVIKEYDGIATNIVMGVVSNKATGVEIKDCTISNSYDKLTWYEMSSFPGYSNVTAKTGAPVYITVVADGFTPATGSATVTILPRGLTNEFAVVAIETNMVYGTVIPDPTWAGGTNLVEGDTLYVNLAYTNDLYGMEKPWPVGKYPEAIVTNLLIAVTNAANEDVTENYTIEFKPATLTITPATIRPEDPKEPENPGDYPPDDGMPPEEKDGAAIWAKNIVKTYDGLGTNVLPQVYYVVDGNNFTYEFTTNVESGVWFSDPDHLAFTNVVHKDDGSLGWYDVSFRAKNTEGNYLGVTNHAYVTILPAPLTLGPVGPVTQPPYGEPPIPPADPDDKNSWTNGAQSVFKKYDRNPTNIVVEVVDPADVEFTFEYSYDRETWSPETVFEGYTDPTNTATVWYAISDPLGNYIPVTNRAFVTIWEEEKEEHGVKMDEEDKKKLDDDIQKIIDADESGNTFIKVQVTVDETNKLDEVSWISPEDAKSQAETIVGESPYPVTDSHFYDIVLERTYEFKIARNEQHFERNYNNSNRWNNAGWDKLTDTGDDENLLRITLTPFTDAQMEGKELIGVFRYHDNGVDEIKDTPDPITQEYYEVDGLKYTLHVKKFSIYGFLLKDKAAMLKATLDWAFNKGTGQYVAQLKFACTNGIDNLDEGEDIKFAFEDRTNSVGEVYAALKAWADGCRFATDAAEETINGTKFRTCVIDKGAEKIKAAGLNNEVCIGPASTSGNAVQMADRQKGWPCLFVADRLKPIADNEESAKSVVKSFLGYVLWKASGVQWALPVTAGANPVEAENWPEQALNQPLSVARMNLCLSLGVPVTVDNDLTCELTEFSVSNGRISGRIATGDGKGNGVPAKSATVNLLGTRKLGTRFDNLGVLNSDPTGRFETDAPAEYQYFKVGVTPGEIVK